MSVVCVCYRSLQQNGRVQSDLQLDIGFSPHLQVAQMTHQPLTELISTATKLHTEKKVEVYTQLLGHE